MQSGGVLVAWYLFHFHSAWMAYMFIQLLHRTEGNPNSENPCHTPIPSPNAARSQAPTRGSGPWFPSEVSPHAMDSHL